MSLRQDVQKLVVDARIELFELDLSAWGVMELQCFHAGTDENRQAVFFNSREYNPWPIQAEGFEWNGQGQFPTPKIRVANIAGSMTALALAYDDLIGAKLTRRRTLMKYLDGQPSADPNAILELDIFFVERKTSENRMAIEWELASGADVEGFNLPARQILPICSFVYRSTECSYAGGPVADKSDVPTSDPDKDDCSKKLKGCQFRFGEHGPMPFGGFMGAGRR